MLTANIATAKNELSRLLRHVKRGGSVLITARNHPVACLAPVSTSTADTPSAALAPLYEAGILSPPAKTDWDVNSFLASIPAAPPLAPERSLTAAVLADREESA